MSGDASCLRPVCQAYVSGVSGARVSRPFCTHLLNERRGRVKYIILEVHSDDGASPFELLEAQVEKHILKGWRPCGGIAAVRSEVFGEYCGTPGTTVAQAMTYDGDELPE